jgi:hypothetical protein
MEAAMDRDPLDPSAYPYRSAVAGDFRADSSAGLEFLIYQDASRVRTFAELYHLRCQVAHFLGAGSMSSMRGDRISSVLDAIERRVCSSEHAAALTYSSRGRTPMRDRAAAMVTGNERIRRRLPRLTEYAIRCGFIAA